MKGPKPGGVEYPKQPFDLPKPDELTLRVEEDQLVVTRMGKYRAMIPMHWALAHPRNLGRLLAGILAEAQDL